MDAVSMLETYASRGLLVLAVWMLLLLLSVLVWSVLPRLLHGTDSEAGITPVGLTGSPDSDA